MKIQGLFSSQSYITASKMLDYAAMKQRVLSNNIANVNTPGFKRSDVDFADELKNMMLEGDKQGVSDFEFKITQPNETSLRNDGNNVDIDKEMAAMSKNGFNFTMYSRVMAGKFNKLRDAITRTK